MAACNRSLTSLTSHTFQVLPSTSNHTQLNRTTPNPRQSPINHTNLLNQPSSMADKKESGGVLGGLTDTVGGAAQGLTSTVGNTVGGVGKGVGTFFLISSSHALPHLSHLSPIHTHQSTHLTSIYTILTSKNNRRRTRRCRQRAWGYGQWG